MDARLTASPLMQSPKDAILSLPKTEGLQFLKATILPWRGMTVYQLSAWLPGLGEVDLLDPPHLDQASGALPRSPSAAGGLLVPFANRLRGTALDGGAAIEAEILGRRVRLPTNWGNPETERLAIHGFLLDAPFDAVAVENGDGEASVSASRNAGDFGGRWISRTQVSVRTALRPRTFALTVTAANEGDEPLPIGIGWHPNFRYPSGEREQVILSIPAEKRALVNSYQDCFPTGELVAVEGTVYDFSRPSGAPLGSLFLDDCFTALRRDGRGQCVCSLSDPAAHFQLSVRAISPEISAIQAYAPNDRTFVAIEPQFNFADPFSPLWGEQNTGMVVLAPGQSVNYQVELELNELP